MDETTNGATIVTTAHPETITKMLCVAIGPMPIDAAGETAVFKLMAQAGFRDTKWLDDTTLEWVTFYDSGCDPPLGQLVAHGITTITIRIGRE